MGTWTILAAPLLAFFLASCPTSAHTITNTSSSSYTMGEHENDCKCRVIVVAKDGTGHSQTVQGAIDMVPQGNRVRIKILIHPGRYREKVVVPASKPYISLIGKGTKETNNTVITWNSKACDRDPDGRMLGTSASASIAIEADYFFAKHITFENNAPSPTPGAIGMQAVALRVSGDKAVLMECRIVGSQDTLFDHRGRHYFWKCYIQGSIDFVFGNGRSLYEECVLHANAASYGAIAASQRDSAGEKSGFSFVRCEVKGSGMLYLGRAWGPYARIVYSLCHFEDIIIPQGWYDWGDASRRRTVLFGEYRCSGPGSQPQGRVPWATSLSYDQVRPFLGLQFIDGEDWLSHSLIT